MLFSVRVLALQGSNLPTLQIAHLPHHRASVGIVLLRCLSNTQSGREQGHQSLEGLSSLPSCMTSLAAMRGQLNRDAMRGQLNRDGLLPCPRKFEAATDSEADRPQGLRTCVGSFDGANQETSTVSIQHHHLYHVVCWHKISWMSVKPYSTESVSCTTEPHERGEAAPMSVASGYHSHLSLSICPSFTAAREASPCPEWQTVP